MRYGRRVPTTGPSGAAFFGVYLAAMVYGFYKIGVGNKKRRELKVRRCGASLTLP